ncbi:uncharacterized protein GGS25DRAFT_505664 [Hypoxylon fragiforme]|uniref:uncharacterized protein n=1 Tax=Hypoxylon fragiforme TaxID=63214 RepID=UPI0020C5D80D|nr:uncharacterized protein GGS25DRAFT_505664 [Hypoxylon fragiforme]KAI2603847.1 hypothetical protein GGS25DRAFT_505664 [Hypoxylon fragiforme]
MAKFDYPYRKSVNITAWVAQFVVCIILIISSALVLKMVGAMDNNDDGQYNEETEYENAMSEYSGLLTSAAGLQIAITGLTIILNIAEIVLVAKKRMHPALYLSSACVKTTIWAVIFIMNLITLSVISIILTLILLTTSIVQLTYGALLIHRKRRGTLTRGVYKPASNPEVCVETGYGSYGYYPQPHSNISTEYKSPAAILPPHYGGGAAGQGQEGGYHMQSGYVPQVPPASYEVDGRSRDAY